MVLVGQSLIHGMGLWYIVYLKYMPTFRYRCLCSISLTLSFLDQLSGTGWLFRCVKFSAFEATKPIKLVNEILDMFSKFRQTPGHQIRPCVTLLLCHSLSFAQVHVCYMFWHCTSSVSFSLFFSSLAAAQIDFFPSLTSLAVLSLPWLFSHFLGCSLYAWHIAKNSMHTMHKTDQM